MLTLALPTRMPFRPGRVDQATGMVTRRVAEDAPGVLVGERLGRDALRLVLRHPRRDRIGRIGAEGQRRGDDHGCG